MREAALWPFCFSGSRTRSDFRLPVTSILPPSSFRTDHCRCVPFTTKGEVSALLISKLKARPVDFQSCLKKVPRCRITPEDREDSCSNTTTDSPRTSNFFLLSRVNRFYPLKTSLVKSVPRPLFYSAYWRKWLDFLRKGNDVLLKRVAFADFYIVNTRNWIILLWIIPCS